MTGSQKIHPFRICISGPLGSGKTQLIAALCRRLSTTRRLAVVVVDSLSALFGPANDGEVASRDVRFLRQLAILPQENICGITNLSEITDFLVASTPDILLIEHSGNDIAAAFNPALVDMTIYMIDMSDGGEAIIRGGTGLTRSDLLLLNKIDLVSVSTELAKEIYAQRGTRAYIPTDLLNGIGLDDVVQHIEDFMKIAPVNRAKREENAALLEEQWFWRYKLSRGAHTHFGSDTALRKKVVSSAPMSAASLRYDNGGSIAWDEMWTDFCDLAALGGPPHRGTLLEPVEPAVCAADPAGYQYALAEIERGLRLVSDLPPVTSSLPGWIGLACDNERMAIWLQQSILAENVSVRRETHIIYLPVGPTFRLKEEIKNVITAVAKTNHYWQEHLRLLQQR